MVTQRLKPIDCLSFTLAKLADGFGLKSNPTPKRRFTPKDGSPALVTEIQRYKVNGV
jgi:hypothetical protein